MLHEFGRKMFEKCQMILIRFIHIIAQRQMIEGLLLRIIDETESLKEQGFTMKRISYIKLRAIVEVYTVFPIQNCSIIPLYSQNELISSHPLNSPNIRALSCNLTKSSKANQSESKLPFCLETPLILLPDIGLLQVIKLNPNEETHSRS
jgi:hypothetical protein